MYSDIWALDGDDVILSVDVSLIFGNSPRFPNTVNSEKWEGRGMEYTHETQEGFRKLSLAKPNIGDIFDH
jgi:hypothetical protein